MAMTARQVDDGNGDDDGGAELAEVRQANASLRAEVLDLRRRIDAITSICSGSSAN